MPLPSLPPLSGTSPGTPVDQPDQTTAAQRAAATRAALGKLELDFSSLAPLDDRPAPAPKQAAPPAVTPADQQALQDRVGATQKALDALKLDFSAFEPNKIQEPRKPGEARIGPDPDKVGKLGLVDFLSGLVERDPTSPTGVKFSRDAESRVPFAGDMVEAADAYSVIQASRRIHEGVGTASDRREVQEFVDRDADAQQRGTTWLYKVADVVFSLPKFAVEIAATGGAYAVGRRFVLGAAEKVAKEAAEAAAKQAVKKGVKEAVSDTAGTAIAQAAKASLARRGLAVAAGSAVRTAALPTMVAKTTLENVAPTAEEFRKNLAEWDDNFSVEFFKAVPDTFLTVFSEMTGGAPAAIGAKLASKSKVAAAAAKQLEVLKNSVAMRWLRLNPNSTWRDLSARIASQAGWHGVIGEVFEERVDEVLKYLQPWYEGDTPAIVRIGTGEASPTNPDAAPPRLEAVKELLAQLAVEGPALAIPGFGSLAMDAMLSKKKNQSIDDVVKTIIATRLAEMGYTTEQVEAMPPTMHAEIVGGRTDGVPAPAKPPSTSEDEPGDPGPPPAGAAILKEEEPAPETVEAIAKDDVSSADEIRQMSIELAVEQLKGTNPSQEQIEELAHQYEATFDLPPPVAPSAAVPAAPADATGVGGGAPTSLASAKAEQEIPTSALSAFPDMPVTAGGLVSLNGFTTDERTALRAAGLVETETSASGDYEYEGVNVERLWKLREARQAEQQAARRAAVTTKAQPETEAEATPAKPVTTTTKEATPDKQAASELEPVTEQPKGVNEARAQQAQPPASPRRYSYTLSYRPPGSATLPRLPWELVERPHEGLGYDKRTDLPVSQHRFGVVSFARELTPDEQAAFELEPVAEQAPVAAQSKGVSEARAKQVEDALPKTPAAVTERPQLPKDLRGAKPRYAIGPDVWTPQFDSDIDRAAFIIAQTKPSPRDADYMAFLRKYYPDHTDTQLRELGATVREQIKKQAFAAKKQGQAGTNAAPLPIAIRQTLQLPKRVVAPTAKPAVKPVEAEPVAKPTKAKGLDVLPTMRTPKDRAARLASLKGRATKREVVLTDGANMYLLSYAQRSGKAGILQAVGRNAQRLLKALNLPEDATMTWKKGVMSLGGGWTIRFTGQTERQAIENGELDRLADVSDAETPATAPEPVAAPKPKIPTAKKTSDGIPEAYRALVVSLLHDARRLGFAGTDQEFSTLFADKLKEARKILKDIQPDGDVMNSPRALLQAISQAGGFGWTKEGLTGYGGEIEQWLTDLNANRDMVITKGKRKGRRLPASFMRSGGLPGIPNIVVRKGGYSADDIRESVAEASSVEDDKWDTLAEFMQAVDNAIRYELYGKPVEGVASDQILSILHGPLGVVGGLRWWQQGELTDAEQSAALESVLSDAAQDHLYSAMEAGSENLMSAVIGVTDAYKALQGVAAEGNISSDRFAEVYAAVETLQATVEEVFSAPFVAGDLKSIGRLEHAADRAMQVVTTDTAPTAMPEPVVEPEATPEPVVEPEATPEPVAEPEVTPAAPVPPADTTTEIDKLKDLLNKPKTPQVEAMPDMSPLGIKKKPDILYQADEATPEEAPLTPEVVGQVVRVLQTYQQKGLSFKDATAAFQQDFGAGARRLDRVLEVAWRKMTGTIVSVLDFLPPLPKPVVEAKEPKATVPKAMVPLGEQKIGMGKHSNVLIKNLSTEYPDYAIWLYGNASSARMKQIREYLNVDPVFTEVQASARTSVEAVLTDEVKTILKQAGIEVTVDEPNGRIWVYGGTYEWRDKIKEFGARGIPKTAHGFVWSFRPDQFDRFVAHVRGLAGTHQRPGHGTAPYLRDPRLGELRKVADGRPDQGAFDVPIETFVGADTADLIRLGLKIGMPVHVIEEQVEDIARINRAYQQKKPMFLLASEPGSGKTYVLGGAIRELRKIGVTTIYYITKSTDLIEQVKTDLAAYDIGDVQFLSYNKMRESKPEASDVIIFDESHSVKNLVGARQAAIAADWMRESKFVLLSSATPFENPVQAEYMQASGIFEEVFGDFSNFALAFGASTFTLQSGNSVLAWRRTATSDDDARAARRWFQNEGIYTSRRIRLAEGAADARLVKVTVNAREQRRYEQFIEAAIENESRLSGFGPAWVKNFSKRLLEASKIEQSIIEAEAALARGRFPIVFVETKAERVIDIPRLIEREAEWAAARDMAERQHVQGPSRKEFGLPPVGIVQVLETYMRLSGEDNIVIPSAEDAIQEHFGAKKVAIYTGSVSPAKAQRNLAEWRSGKRPLLVATMAKGGTGLSLHDKKGDHQTTQINVNLPWTATSVVQVAQRSARYGLVGKAEMQWIFADNIPFDRALSRRVGGRMADMGALVHGERLEGSEEIEDWTFTDTPFSELAEGIEPADYTYDALKQEGEEEPDDEIVVDRLSTGEDQMRLPGDVGRVRDEETTPTESTVMPFTPDTLTAAYNLTPAQTTDLMTALVQGAAIDTGRLNVVFGGRPGEATRPGVVLKSEDPAETEPLFQKATTHTVDPSNPAFLPKETPAVRRLAVMHNLSAANLLFADEMGGLPVPSLAVTHEDGALSGFGEITLIGTRDLADPATTPVYDADIYSIRYPRPIYPKAKAANIKPIADRLRPFAQKFEAFGLLGQLDDLMRTRTDPRQLMREMQVSRAAQAWYLSEVLGIDVAPIRQPVDVRYPWVRDAQFQEDYVRIVGSLTQVPAMSDLTALGAAVNRALKRLGPETRAGTTLAFGATVVTLSEADRIASSLRLMNATELDRPRTELAIAMAMRKSSTDAAFEAWVEAQIKPALTTPQLRVRGKLVPFTLDNILAVMSGPRQRGRERTMTFSEGKARAVAARKFRSTDEMRKAAERSVAVSNVERDAAVARSQRAVGDWRSAVKPFWAFDNKWDPLVVDASMRAFARWARGSRTPASLRYELSRENFRNVPEDVIDEGVEAGEVFLETPVEYFEAKPQRVVHIGEFAGAIIPAMAPGSVRDVLTRHGVPFSEYGRQSDRPAAAIAFRRELANNRADVLFQARRNIKGQTELLSDGTALLHGFQTADGSTAIHELAHVIAHQILNRNLPAEQRAGISDADLDLLERWLGIQDGVWTTAAHEQFARALERYFYDGVAPTPALRPIFARIRDWMVSVYQHLEGSPIDIEIPSEIRELFGRVITRGARLDAMRAAESRRTQPRSTPVQDDLFGSGRLFQEEDPNVLFQDEDTSTKRITPERVQAAVTYMRAYSQHGDGEAEFHDAVTTFQTEWGPEARQYDRILELAWTRLTGGTRTVESVMADEAKELAISHALNVAGTHEGTEAEYEAARLFAFQRADAYAEEHGISVEAFKAAVADHDPALQTSLQKRSGKPKKERPMGHPLAIAGAGVMDVLPPAMGTEDLKQPPPKALRHDQIVKKLAKALGGLPIASGKVPPGFAGQLKKSGVVRSRIAHDLWVLFHELGHALDVLVMKHSKNLKLGPVSRELENMGQLTSKPSYKAIQLRREGVANYVRQWLVDPSVIENAVEGELYYAPTYTTAFNAFIVTSHPAAKAFRQARTEMEARQSLSPHDQVAINIDFLADHYPQWIEDGLAWTVGTMEDPRHVGDRLATGVVDDKFRLWKMEQQLTDGNVDVGESVYWLWRMLPGAVRRAEGFVHYGIRNAKGDRLGGKGLLQIINPIIGRYKDLSIYMVARRARRAIELGLETGLRADNVMRVLDKAENDEVLTQAVDEINQFKGDFLSYLVEEGFLTPAMRAKWEARWQDTHIPFKRVRDRLATAVSGAAPKVHPRVPRFMRKFVGSAAPIADPLVTVLEDIYDGTTAAMENKAMLELFDLADTETWESGEKTGGKWLEMIPPDMVPHVVNLKALRKPILESLTESGVNTEEFEKDASFLDAMATIWMPKQFVEMGKRYVSALRMDGTRQWAIVHDAGMWEMITQNPATLGAVLKTLRVASRSVRATATLNLPWMMRNIVRDVTQAKLYTPKGFSMADWFRGMSSVTFQTKDWQLFLHSLAGQSNFTAQDRDVFKRELNRMGHGRLRRFLDATIFHPFDLLSMMREMSEMSTRTGVFIKQKKAELKRAGTVETEDMSGLDEAAMRRLGVWGREVNQDFQKMGTWVRDWNQMAAFLGARIGGWSRAAEELKAHPGRLATRLMPLVAFAILLWYLNQDDDEYDALEDWVKQMYFVVPVPEAMRETGAGPFVFIPRPFEWGDMMNLVEAGLTAVSGDPDWRQRMPMDRGVAYETLMLLMPNAMLGPMEAMANYSLFMDAPIVSPYDTKIDPALQYNRYTPEVMKRLGETMGMSPAKLDHMFYSYGTSVYRTLTRLADDGLAAAGAIPPQPSEGVLAVPGARAFFRASAPGRADVNDFYDRLDKMEGGAQSVRRHLKSGDVDRAQARSEALGLDISTRGTGENQQYVILNDDLRALRKAQAAMRDVRADVDAIYQNWEMTPNEKRIALDGLTLDIVNIAREALGKSPLARTLKDN